MPVTSKKTRAQSGGAHGGAASPDGVYFLPIHDKKSRGGGPRSGQEEIAFAYNTTAQRLSIKHQLRLKISYPTTRLDDPEHHQDELSLVDPLILAARASSRSRQRSPAPYPTRGDSRVSRPTSVFGSTAADLPVPLSHRPNRLHITSSATFHDGPEYSTSNGDTADHTVPEADHREVPVPKHESENEENEVEEEEGAHEENEVEDVENDDAGLLIDEEREDSIQEEHVPHRGDDTEGIRESDSGGEGDESEQPTMEEEGGAPASNSPSIGSSRSHTPTQNKPDEHPSAQPSGPKTKRTKKQLKDKKKKAKKKASPFAGRSLEPIQTYKRAPTFQEEIEADRIRDNMKKMKHLSVYLKPLQSKAPASHSSTWDNTSTAEPVFKYNSVKDQFLTDYFSRSKHAQECLVSHGIVTKGGKLVNMHHAGGKIWLGEKRHRNAEERKAWDEDQQQAERVVEEVRKKEMLRDVERTGRINKLRVAEHVSYLRKKNSRDKEAAHIKEVKRKKALERRKQDEMEDLALYLLSKDRSLQRQQMKNITNKLGGGVLLDATSTTVDLLDASGGGKTTVGEESTAYGGDQDAPLNVLDNFSAIQMYMQRNREEDWEGGDGGWRGEDEEEGEDKGNTIGTGDFTGDYTPTHSLPTHHGEVSTIPRAHTTNTPLISDIAPPRPISSAASSARSGGASRPNSSQTSARSRKDPTVVIQTARRVLWEQLSQLDPDIVEVVTTSSNLDLDEEDEDEL